MQRSVAGEKMQGGGGGGGIPSIHANHIKRFSKTEHQTVNLQPTTVLLLAPFQNDHEKW